MQLAVLGSGKIVHEFLPAVAEIPGLELRAIWGRAHSAVTLAELAGRFHIPAVYTDLDACLADPGVDTVYVAVPNAVHADFARRALLAGKNVICEKPFTLDVADLRELRTLATERDLILVEAINTVYLSNFLALRDRLPDIGQLTVIQCEYSQYSSRYPAFLAGATPPVFDPAMGGGALLDIGIYPLHVVAGLLGRPRSVRYVANVTRGVDTSGVVTLDYGSATAVCVCAKDSGGPLRTKIAGQDGGIVMDSAPNVCRNFTVQLRGQEPEVVDHQVADHRMVEEFRAFEAIIAHHDTAARDAALDHSELVLEIAAQALESAGLHLGPR